MQQERYNTFNQIHKALRNMLYDTAISLQVTDLSSEAAAPTITRLEQTLHLFDDHAMHEDNFVLPHVKKHNAQLVDELEKDHVVDHKLSDDLANYITAWKEAPDAYNRASLGSRIFYAFNEFVAFNLYHMNREENELIYVLWKHYTDAEIIQMEQEILKVIPPETLMIESRWMMRSINDTEIIHWLRAVKNNAPEEVFDGFLRMAEEELAPERVAAVLRGLQAGHVAA